MDGQDVEDTDRKSRDEVEHAYEQLGGNCFQKWRLFINVTCSLYICLYVLCIAECHYTVYLNGEWYIEKSRNKPIAKHFEESRGTKAQVKPYRGRGIERNLVTPPPQKKNAFKHGVCLFVIVVRCIFLSCIVERMLLLFIVYSCPVSS